MGGKKNRHNKPKHRGAGRRRQDNRASPDGDSSAETIVVQSLNALQLVYSPGRAVSPAKLLDLLASPAKLRKAIAELDRDALVDLLSSDVEDRKFNGYYPLLHAAVHRGKAAVALLVEKGAKIDDYGVFYDAGEAKVYEDVTPLWLACLNGKPEVAQFLVENGANVETASSCGRTALMNAVVDGNIDLAAALADRGADPNRYDAFGESALTLACSKACVTRIKLVKSLVQIDGIDINCAYGKTGRTALHGVCARGDQSLLDVLVEAGAWFHKDFWGMTPRMVACANGRGQLAHYICCRIDSNPMGDGVPQAWRQIARHYAYDYNEFYAAEQLLAASFLGTINCPLSEPGCPHHADKKHGCERRRCSGPKDLNKHVAKYQSVGLKEFLSSTKRRVWQRSRYLTMDGYDPVVPEISSMSRFFMGSERDVWQLFAQAWDMRKRHMRPDNPDLFKDFVLRENFGFPPNSVNWSFINDDRERKVAQEWTESGQETQVNLCKCLTILKLMLRALGSRKSSDKFSVHDFSNRLFFLFYVCEPRTLLYELTELIAMFTQQIGSRYPADDGYWFNREAVAAERDAWFKAAAHLVALATQTLDITTDCEFIGAVHWYLSAYEKLGIFARSVARFDLRHSSGTNLLIWAVGGMPPGTEITPLEEHDFEPMRQLEKTVVKFRVPIRPAMVRFLLESGGVDPDYVASGSGLTALMTLCANPLVREFPQSPQVVNMLADAAHLDLTSREGKMAIDYLPPGHYLAPSLRYKMNNSLMLKCLAARAVSAHRLDYDGLKDDLRRMVASHRCFPADGAAVTPLPMLSPSFNLGPSSMAGARPTSRRRRRGRGRPQQVD